MRLDCWNIQGESFHFGRHGLGQEQTMDTMPSDSLFAALVARLARTEGAQAVANFCRPFVDHDPPFVVSSTYPFAGRVKFFPVPMRARSGDVQGLEAKKLKRVRFVSEGIFRSMLKGESLASLYDEKRTLQKGSLLVGGADQAGLPAELNIPGAKVWDMEQRPRVTLDRARSTSNLFHIGQVYFSQGCGLWFAVHWLKEDPDLKNQFKGMLHELAAAGLGAERSVGLGIAKVQEAGTLDLPDPQEGWVTLSRYLPKEDEAPALGSAGSSYSIRPVGGWLDSPTNMGQRRIPVNLIEEGSVIGTRPVRPVPGQIADVRPRYQAGEDVLGHPVYRCGLALAVGLEGGAG